MLNEIYLKKNNCMILKTEKKGRNNFCYLSNGEVVPICSLISKERVLVKCHNCSKLNEITLYSGRFSPLNKIYICLSCNKIGKSNPFYGKKHSKEFKNKLSEERKGKWYIGEKNSMYGINVWDSYDATRAQEIRKKISERNSGKNNPFYGKKHTKETLSEICKKTKIHRDNLTKEEKEAYSKKISESQKRLQKEDPEKYISLKRKAGLISTQKHEKYKINKIEQKVLDELKKRNLEFDYSVILGFFQFDFGSKKYRMLLEVQGDYWHGNSKYFGTEDGKRNLNNIQIANIEKDLKKKKFAEKNQISLYTIWEDDINNGNFYVLDQIEKDIKCLKNMN